LAFTRGLPVETARMKYRPESFMSAPSCTIDFVPKSIFCNFSILSVWSWTCHRALPRDRSLSQPAPVRRFNRLASVESRASYVMKIFLASALERTFFE
jgi:hypothetical protein